MNQTDYELIDFGAGRKLERFGDTIFDRPTPVANDAKKALPELWSNANVRYQRLTKDTGKWTGADAVEFWPFQSNDFKLQLSTTPFGHLGVFPEQIENWSWIQRQVRQLAKQGSGNEACKPRVLNLFAYTGGSTLAAASAGASVVHIDSAKNIVNWAKRNANYSGLAKAPIRWIDEDAALFIRREVKRGNQYEGIILDPPTYGHGAAGQTWKIQRHLLPLLNDCRKLLKESGVSCC